MSTQEALRIGVDIDGTLSQTWEYWVEYCARHGVRFSLEEIRISEELFSFGSHSFADVRAVVDRNPDVDREYAIYPGAAAVLALLAHHDIFIITARGDFKQGLIEATHYWLEQNAVHHREVHFAHRGSKVEICQELNIAVMIDDDPRHAIALTDAGIPILLFDQPYNRSLEHPGVTRFTHWLEVPALLKRLFSAQDTK